MIKFENWGEIEYSEALDRQMKVLDQVDSEELDGVVVLCTHPEVVTLGRASKAEDLIGWDGKLLQVSRGGRATYHGPSQLVIYPIINLKKEHKNLKAREVVGAIRLLEDSLVNALKKFGINAVGKSLQKKTENELAAEETGVWVGSKKIASIGIAVKKWVTYHGAAINLDYDQYAFRGLRPCGFSKEVMTSLESETHQKIDREKFIQEFIQTYSKQLM